MTAINAPVEISADFSDGVLMLSAPRHAETEPQPKKVQVKKK